MQIEAIALWIENSAIARFVATAPLVYPLVSAIHLLGISTVVGSILFVDLRLLKLVGPQFDAVLSSLVRACVSGFAIAAAMGLLLASVRLADYISNPAFVTKLLVLLAAGLNAVLFRVVSKEQAISQMADRPAGQIFAVSSLLFWTGAVLAGRWIAFT
jgi:hypothetical protein